MGLLPEVRNTCLFQQSVFGLTNSGKHALGDETLTTLQQCCARIHYWEQEFASCSQARLGASILDSQAEIENSKCSWHYPWMLVDSLVAMTKTNVTSTTSITRNQNTTLISRKSRRVQRHIFSHDCSRAAQMVDTQPFIFFSNVLHTKHSGVLADVFQLVCNVVAHHKQGHNPFSNLYLKTSQSRHSQPCRSQNRYPDISITMCSQHSPGCVMKVHDGTSSWIYAEQQNYMIERPSNAPHKACFRPRNPEMQSTLIQRLVLRGLVCSFFKLITAPTHDSSETRMTRGRQWQCHCPCRVWVQKKW